MRPKHFVAVRSDAAAALPLAEFATFGFSVVAVVQVQCAARTARLSLAVARALA